MHRWLCSSRWEIWDCYFTGIVQHVAVVVLCIILVSVLLDPQILSLSALFEAAGAVYIQRYGMVELLFCLKHVWVSEQSFWRISSKVSKFYECFQFCTAAPSKWPASNLLLHVSDLFLLFQYIFHNLSHSRHDSCPQNFSSACSIDKLSLTSMKVLLFAHSPLRLFRDWQKGQNGGGFLIFRPKLRIVTACLRTGSRTERARLLSSFCTRQGTPKAAYVVSSCE